jgi:uncharacterized protein (TIGR02391 family)
VGNSNDVLYTFAPIGRAIFAFQTAIGLGQLIRQGDLKPRFDLAGLSRQASEKGEPPLVITNGVFGAPRIDVPNTFEEKREHFLRLLYESGGSEYRERTINTFDDFPMAFATDAEQFYRILKSLLAEDLIKYAKSQVVQGDWKNGIQAHYHEVLPTSAAKHFLAAQKQHAVMVSPAIPISLATLHPTLQQAAGSRFASGHYSDAIQKACTALEKVVQAKVGQPATITGTSLMTTAFSKNNPLIQLAADPNEQLGFMNLYQGTVQALRNHYAHNLTELTDPARALEWLGFISALFYKLDDALVPHARINP